MKKLLLSILLSTSVLAEGTGTIGSGNRVQGGQGMGSGNYSDGTGTMGSGNIAVVIEESSADGEVVILVVVLPES